MDTRVQTTNGKAARSAEGTAEERRLSRPLGGGGKVERMRGLGPNDRTLRLTKTIPTKEERFDSQEEPRVRLHLQPLSRDESGGAAIESGDRERGVPE